MGMVTGNVEEMENIAAEFAAHLALKDGGGTVVALSGNLGAGKTTFARGIARAFGIEEDVTSPTYVIENIYEPARGPFKRLIHIDAYRLAGAHELDVLGWKKLIAEPGNLVILEWPEKVEGALPSDVIRVSLSGEDEKHRTISIA